MEEESNTQRVKRFKVRYAFSFYRKLLTFDEQHQSYQATLKDVHLPPALTQSGFDHGIGVRNVSGFVTIS